MLDRVLEPEAMDDEQEALEYDLMDHAAVNRAFVEDFLKVHRGGWPVLDAGTGTALIPVELCCRCPGARVVGLDIAMAMLRRGQQHLRDLGLENAILLVRASARRIPLADASVPAVMSNSLIHHIPEPMQVLSEMVRVLAARGTLFIRDLFRPADEKTLEELVSRYAGDATEKQREMFSASLRAALTVEEVRQLVQALGIPAECVRATSDRHWTLCWQKPAIGTRTNC